MFTKRQIHRTIRHWFFQLEIIKCSISTIYSIHIISKKGITSSLECLQLIRQTNCISDNFKSPFIRTIT